MYVTFVVGPLREAFSISIEVLNTASEMPLPATIFVPGGWYIELANMDKYTFGYFSDYVHSPEFSDIPTGPRLLFTFEIFIGQFLKCANLYALADMFAIRELKQSALSALRQPLFAIASRLEYVEDLCNFIWYIYSEGQGAVKARPRELLLQLVFRNSEAEDKEREFQFFLQYISQFPSDIVSRVAGRFKT